ncbi:MAG: hypothetical protein MUC93_13365 [Bacteroidales bacterium]|nr:hypothetical protein [Bacteroidales bacterium]
MSSKTLNCVSEQFNIDDPVKIIVDFLPRLLKQNKHFDIRDIKKAIISLVNERYIKKIQENISTFFELHLGINIVNSNRSNGWQINVDSLKSNYIPSLAEYLILHLYDLAKKMNVKSTKLTPKEDQKLYKTATDIYDIIWHKLSEGEKTTVKGRLTNVKEIKGEDPKMPFAYLKLMNSENQELIIQVRSNKYQKSLQKIHSGKGEVVAIQGQVQYDVRRNQNIVILDDIMEAIKEELYDFEVDQVNYKKFNKKLDGYMNDMICFEFKVTDVIDQNHTQGKILSFK